MSDYVAPLKDISFLLNELSEYDRVLEIPELAEYGEDLSSAIFEEAAKFANGVLAPLYQVGDVEGCKFENGKVTTPTGWKAAYQQFCENGWLSLSMPEIYGGQELPQLISMPVNEMWLSANLPFVMFHTLAEGCSKILEKSASQDLKDTYQEKIVSGEWTCCMSLTEPGAGSDLSNIKTKAVRLENGQYLITGQKIFITYGEHDLTDNILHFVLARTPDAPEGTKGISLFLVPKRHVASTGTEGESNDVNCVSIEHKTGLHGSPTCVMTYGDTIGSVGELIGAENEGLKNMFILMNEARLSVGLQGVGLSEVGFQKALEFCQERKQGRHPNTNEKNVEIIHHPDIQRMLLSIRAQVMSLRALGYLIGSRITQVEHCKDKTLRKEHNQFISLLTPVFKAFSTESANEIAGKTIQIFGGMGFIEETGVAQLMRDVRITTIYEGTTGIQATDLVMRKIMMDQGNALLSLLDEIKSDGEKFKQLASFENESHVILNACSITTQALDYLLSQANADKTALLAGSVPFLEMIGILCCSWQMSRIALKADEKIKAGLDLDYHSNLSALAKFYFAHFTPRITALYTTFINADAGLKDYNFNAS
jgi:3-(methylthio)propanoyl-CoA dehydrogenase